VSIRSNLAGVVRRIEAACASVGRNPAEVTLIAVSKLHSIEEIQEAYDCGQRDFGESRLQEAEPKIEALPPDIIWHFIGSLQSNKAKKIATLFEVVHTFCKPAQIAEADKSSRPVSGLIEVNVAEEAQKSGISVKELDEFSIQVIESSNVHFRGLMTIGPIVSNAEEMRPYFREMQMQRTRLGADWLSMGMSGDFEVAIQEGASHIRVGTAIFGSRQ
jgi:pyridoxal phosphate enzyme (YggS family)